MKKSKITFASFLLLSLLIIQKFQASELKRFSESSSSVKSDPISILIIAKGDIQAAQKALDNGAAINSAYRQSGLTPLIVAITHNKVEMVSFLLKNGADANKIFYICYSYTTPLILAIEEERNPEIINLLIKNGADVNAQDSHGDTALITLTKYSKLKNYKKITEILLEANANINIANNERQTFLNIIRMQKSNARTRIKYETSKHILKILKDFKIKQLMNAFENDDFKLIYDVLVSYPELIDQQNEIGETILDQAILFGRFEIIKELFENPNIKVKPNLLIGRISNYLFDETNPVEYAQQLGRPGCDPTKKIYRDIAAYLRKKRDLQ